MILFQKWDELAKEGVNHNSRVFSSFRNETETVMLKVDFAMKQIQLVTLMYMNKNVCQTSLPKDCLSF